MQPKKFGTVHFDTQPHGAMIYVDGQLLINPDTEESLKTPATALLVEGRRDFTFSLSGYTDESGYVDVLAGVTVSIFRNLQSGKAEGGWGKPQPQIWLDQNTQYVPEVPSIPYYKPIKSMQSATEGNLVITSYPDGATITMNGKTVIDMDTKEPLKTPTQLAIGMGLHNFVFKLPGYCNEFDSVYIIPGSTSYIHETFHIC